MIKSKTITLNNIIKTEVKRLWEIAQSTRKWLDETGVFIVGLSGEQKDLAYWAKSSGEYYSIHHNSFTGDEPVKQGFEGATAEDIEVAFAMQLCSLFALYPDVDWSAETSPIKYEDVPVCVRNLQNINTPDTNVSCYLLSTWNRMQTVSRAQTYGRKLDIEGRLLKDLVYYALDGKTGVYRSDVDTPQNLTIHSLLDLYKHSCLCSAEKRAWGYGFRRVDEKGNESKQFSWEEPNKSEIGVLGSALLKYSGIVGMDTLRPYLAERHNVLLAESGSLTYVMPSTPLS